jgi:hypothetical protein
MTIFETCMPFETGRLLVRQLEEGDIGTMLEVYGDPEAMRWVPITTWRRWTCGRSCLR